MFNFLRKKVVKLPKPVPNQTNQIIPIGLQPGQRIYELDLNTGQICEPQILFSGKFTFVFYHKDSIYEVSINKRNAERKLILRMKDIIKKHKNESTLPRP